MGIHTTKLSLIISYSYGPNFLKTKLRSGIHKSWIYMLTGCINSFIVSCYLRICPNIGNLFAVNQNSTIFDHPIGDRVNGGIGDCKFAVLGFFCDLCIGDRSRQQQDTYAQHCFKVLHNIFCEFGHCN
jgi:hypothetical protein